MGFRKSFISILLCVCILLYNVGIVFGVMALDILITPGQKNYLYVGETLDIYFDLFPEGADEYVSVEPSIEYESRYDGEDGKVLDIEDITLNGAGSNYVTVFGVGCGEARLVLTLIRSDDEVVETYYDIVVLENITGIDVQVSELDETLDIGDTFTVKYNYIPDYADAHKSLFSVKSSDENVLQIVSVDSKSREGEVQAVGYGTAHIIVTYDDPDSGVHIEGISETITVAPKYISVIELDVSDPVNLEINQTIEVNVSIEPEGALIENVACSSSDTNVATCTLETPGKFIITGVGTGSAIVKFYDTNGNSGTSTETSILVNVIDSSIPDDPDDSDDPNDSDNPEPPVYSAIYFKTSSETMPIGGSLQLELFSIPSGIKFDEVTLISTNQSVAIVDSAGRVTGIEAGKSTIFAVLPNGLVASVDIIVEDNSNNDDGPIYDEIYFRDDDITIKVDEEVQLRLYSRPSGISERDVTWTTDDEDIVDVDSRGRITGISEGRARVYATLSDSLYAYIDVEVESDEEDLKDLKMNIVYDDGKNEKLNEITMTIGEERELDVSFSTEDISKKMKIKWESSDEDVVTVSRRGVVKALKPGTAIVTAYASYDDTEIETKVRVTVSYSESYWQKLNIGNMPSSRNIVITFSKPISTTEGQIYLSTNSNGGYDNNCILPVINGNKAIFTVPSGGWSQGKQYYIFVEGVKSIYGETLNGRLRYEFTTTK